MAENDEKILTLESAVKKTSAYENSEFKLPYYGSSVLKGGFLQYQVDLGGPKAPFKVDENGWDRYELEISLGYDQEQVAEIFLTKNSNAVLLSKSGEITFHKFRIAEKKLKFYAVVGKAIAFKDPSDVVVFRASHGSKNNSLFVFSKNTPDENSSTVLAFGSDQSKISEIKHLPLAAKDAALLDVSDEKLVGVFLTSDKKIEIYEIDLTLRKAEKLKQIDWNAAGFDSLQDFCPTKLEVDQLTQNLVILSNCFDQKVIRSDEAITLSPKDDFKIVSKFALETVDKARLKSKVHICSFEQFVVTFFEHQKIIWIQSKTDPLTRVKIESDELGLEHTGQIEFLCFQEMGIYALKQTSQDKDEIIRLYDGNSGFNKDRFKHSLIKNSGIRCSDSNLQSLESSILILSSNQDDEKKCKTRATYVAKSQSNLIIKAGVVKSEHTWDLTKKFEVTIKIDNFESQG